MSQDYAPLAQVVEQVLEEAEYLASHIELLYRLTFSKETLGDTSVQELAIYRSNTLWLLMQVNNVRTQEPEEELWKTEGETYRRILQVYKAAEETLKRLIATEVLADFALHRQDHPDIGEQMEYAHLSVLGYLNGLAMRAAEYLNTLHEQELTNWPSLIHQDDDEQEEEEEVVEDIISPKELGNFRRLRASLERGLEVYAQANPSQELRRFRQALKAYLDVFAEGKEPEGGLKFSFSYEDEDVRYAQFNLEKQILEISLGGSEYTPGVGHDSYTSWMYSLGLSGWEDNPEWRDFDDLLGLVESGDLNVDYPDDLIFSDRDRKDS